MTMRIEAEEREGLDTDCFISLCPMLFPCCQPTRQSHKNNRDSVIQLAFNDVHTL